MRLIPEQAGNAMGPGESWFGVASMAPGWLAAISPCSECNGTGCPECFQGKRKLASGNSEMYLSEKWVPIVDESDPRREDVIVVEGTGVTRLYMQNGQRPVKLVGHADPGGYAARLERVP